MNRPIVLVAMAYVAGLCAGPLLQLPATLTLALIALIGLSQVYFSQTENIEQVFQSDGLRAPAFL